MRQLCLNSISLLKDTLYELSSSCETEFPNLKNMLWIFGGKVIERNLFKQTRKCKNNFYCVRFLNWWNLDRVQLPQYSNWGSSMEQTWYLSTAALYDALFLSSDFHKECECHCNGLCNKIKSLALNLNTEIVIVLSENVFAVSQKRLRKGLHVCEIFVFSQTRNLIYRSLVTI